MHARMTNMDGALPSDKFGYVEVEAKEIMRTPTASQQHDHKFGVDNIHTPESKDQCFATNLVDRFGPNEARDPNSMISRHIISPMVSAILDELSETASSILAEDDAGLAALDSQIEEARNLNSAFKHVVLPRLHVSSSDLVSKVDDAVGASNSKHDLLCTTSPSNERSPSCHDLNGSGCLERCAEEVTKEVNLVPSHFAPSFEGEDDNALRRRESEVANLRHRYNASARLDFSSESLTGDRLVCRISQECELLHTTKDFLPSATPMQQIRALQLVNSSMPQRIPRDQAHQCNSTDVHRSNSSEIRSSIPITEDSDFDIFSGKVDVQHEDEGLRCNSQGSSEGCRRRWWDMGRSLLLPWASRGWRKLCWYGEILLGGIVCVVLALPLAAALAKALASPPDYLIPT